MKRVLVTGARGFIGGPCLALLRARSYEVHALSREMRDGMSEGVFWHQADVLDSASTSRVLHHVRPTHLLHLAWNVIPGQYIQSVENYAWVSASMSLVQRFAELGGVRVVAAGSSYEYDWNYGFCSETLTPLAPDTVYGTCKHALQVMLQAAASTLPLSIAWPRIFFLYGPNEHPDRLVSYVIRSLLGGEPAKCSSGNQVRDYLYIGDAADALVALLDSEVAGPINIASGIPVQLRDLVYTIGRIIGRESLLQLGSIPSRPNDKPLVVGNVQRLRSELSWMPKFTLEQGLARTIAWWRAQSVPRPAGVR